MYLQIAYLKPKTYQFLNKHSKYYIKSGQEGHIVRNIYEKVEYDEYENQLIEEFKECITQQLPNNWKTSDYLKMLVSADFQIPQALHNLSIHLQWLNYYNLHEPNIKQLQIGDFYIFGIDKQCRPVIIIKNIDKDNFLSFQYFLETIKRQVLIPYFVENWTVILDQQQEDLANYNFEMLKPCFDELMINFCGNLNILLIVNSSLEFTNLITLIPNKTQIHSKLKIVNRLPEMQQYVLAEQLEEKYGGICPNVTQYWPPLPPKTLEQMNSSECIEEFGTNKQIFQEFKGRNLTKFSSLGRMQHNTTVSNQRDASISYGGRSSISQLSSHMKIVVREENGNQLIEQDIEMSEEESVQSNKKSKKSKPKVTEVKMEGNEYAGDLCCEKDCFIF